MMHLNGDEGAFGFAHFATVEPQKSAIIEADGRSWTRAELFELSNRVARALLRAGLSPGDTLALLSQNCGEFISVYFAAIQIGLYFVPVNWHLSVEEIRHVLQQSTARALIVENRLCARARQALQTGGTGVEVRVVLGEEEEGFLGFDRLIEGESAAKLDTASTGRVLVFTSATTGFPKCVVRSLHEAQTARKQHLQIMASLYEGAGVSPGTGTHLCQSLLYHTVPLSHAVSALNLGHRLVLMKRWTPERALQLIERHDVATTFMVPSMFVQLLKLPEAVRSRYSTDSLRLVTHGGAATPVEIKRQMIEWWGLVIHELYGASEGIATGVTASEWLRHPGTVGRAHPGTALKILDDSGNELPPGQVGLIYIRSYPGEQFSYKDDPQKTEAAYRDGYFTAGDVGYLNTEGYLFICDRRVDMLIRGGVNIYPAEVERALILHPQVSDCAVVGIPDPIFGEAVVAAIELMPGLQGDQRLTTDILRFLAGVLSPEKLPTRIEYLDSLPRDPAGKMHKRRLRQDLQATHGAGQHAAR